MLTWAALSTADKLPATPTKAATTTATKEQSDGRRCIDRLVDLAVAKLRACEFTRRLTGRLRLPLPFLTVTYLPENLTSPSEDRVVVAVVVVAAAAAAAGD